MTELDSLPKELQAKRKKDLARIERSGNLPLPVLFRMIYENIEANKLARKFAPEELKKLKISMNEVVKSIDTIAIKIQKHTESKTDRGGKSPPPSPTEQSTKPSLSARRARAKK